MSTNFNNQDFGVELYNIIDNNEPLIYTRATFGYPEWIKTRDIAKTEGYTSDQFNDLILIPNGDYTYVETKRIRGQYYHHIKIEMNDTLLQQLLEATGSTAEDLDIGKLQSNFYVDADGIPYIIETEYITSNSVLEIEIELEKVNQITELVVPERILESAIDVD
jgi:hypothetical protein